MASKRKDRAGWIAWARVAPGPKGRIAVYAATAEAADVEARALEAAARIPDLPNFSPGSFAHFVYKVWTPRTYPEVRSTTRQAYDGLLVHHILPALGRLPIADIGYTEMDTLKRSIARRDKREGLPSPKRVREILMLVKSILGLYAKLERAQNRQAREDWSLVRMPEPPRKKERPQPEADFTERLMAQAKGHWMEGPLLCALFLGLRRGEVCGLKWSAIDRQELRLSVSEQRHPKLAAGSTTKGKPRTLPITERLIQHLDALGDRESVYVFTMPGKGGRIPLLENEISKQTPRLCAKAKVGRRTFHDLRSFAASNLLDLGVDLVSIMEILGHTKIDTTELYLYAREKSKREGLSKLLDARLGDISKTG